MPTNYHELSFHNRLHEACRPMSVRRWRAVKGFVYVLLIGAVAVTGILERQIIVPIVFIMAAMLIFGIEVKEIQIADYVSVTFFGAFEHDDGGQGEGDDGDSGDGAA